MRIARNDNFQTRRMGKISFWRLTVVVTTSDTAAVWRAEHQTTDVKFIAGAVTELGRFVDDLVKGRKDVVGKLNFGDWRHALRRHTIGKTGDALFCKRRVKTTRFAVFFLQLRCRAEHTAKMADIFTKTHHAIVFGHR